MKKYVRLYTYIFKNKIIFIVGVISIIVAISAEGFTLRVIQDLIKVFESSSKIQLGTNDAESRPQSDLVPNLLPSATDIPELKDRIWYDPIIYTFYDSGHDLYAYFVLLFIIGFGISLMRLVSAFGADFFMLYLGRKVIYLIRNDLFYNLVHYPLSFFNKQRIGNLSSIVNNDVVVIENFCQSAMIAIIRDPLKIMFFMGYMILISPLLTLVVLILAPILTIFIYGISEWIKRIEKRIREKLAEINAILYEVLFNIPIIKLFATEHSEKEKFHGENTKYLGLEKRFYLARSTASPIAEFSGYIGTLVILAIGGYQILWGNEFFQFSSLAAFAGAIFFISGPLQNLSKSLILIKQSGVSAQRIFNLMDQPREPFIIINAKTFPPIRGEVQFKGVTFAYEENRPVLNDVNLHIPSGQSVALVGSSGGGKSTLVSLIPGLYKPQQGSILVDGNDIWDYDIISLRKQMAFVPQETFLFHGSVRENITYGKPNASEDEIHEALRIAHAHEFVAQLPNKMDTLIGERGVQLSGGQQQRIAIARAVLRKPGLLILDEATSSLDNESERYIQQAFSKIIRFQTTIIIAHRLSTVLHVDRILVVDQGRIVEDGNHQTLLEKKGIYYRLYSMQHT